MKRSRYKGKSLPGLTTSCTSHPSSSRPAADFLRLKPQMVRVGDVKTFENFIVAVPANVDPGKFTAVIVWCESFSQFITAAQYK